MYPVSQEIFYQDPRAIFGAFAHRKGSILLDSSHQMSGCGRYTFIALDPFQVLTSKHHEVFLNDKKISGDPFQVLREQLALYPLKLLDAMPPFQGGAAGFFSYDLYEHLEPISSSQQDVMQFPDMAIGFYDVVIGFDLVEHRAWIFSSGYPELDEAKRTKRAWERVREWELSCWKASRAAAKQEKTKSTQSTMSIASNFTKDEYCQAVSRVKNYIRAGDIFEANISQCFSAKFSEIHNAFDLYLALQKINPAPFSAFLYFDETALVSASPERFLKISGRKVEARPIKGTRPRGKTTEDDQRLQNELLQSEKDHAENVMIVDLLRNDLSRVCEPHSVEVPQLCGLETYASVHHLVSVITGKLQKDVQAIDLLSATFPGGSITGAPKIRAMEIIAEIEPTRRGPYCGSIGYIGFNGDMDLSITIRTFAIKNNKVTFQAGGAVVLDSNPEDEYAETLAKISSLQRALHDFVN